MGGVTSANHEDTQLQDPNNSTHDLNLDPYNIREEHIETSPRICDRTILCSECNEWLLRKDTVATFICYQCEKYICVGCVYRHGNHEVIVEKGKDEDVDMFIKHMFLEKDRDEAFMEGTFLLIDQIYYRYILGHKINSLCMFSNENLAVCVSDKYIGIYENTTYNLHRFIKFGSQPYGMAEFISKSAEETRIISSFRPDDNWILAVTLPHVCGILFIDLGKSPAEVVKTIQLQRQCYEIAFDNDQIYVLCYSSDRANWIICILSLEGQLLSDINTFIQVKFRMYTFFNCASIMAILDGKIFITSSNKVYCFEVDANRNISFKSSLNVPGATRICSDDKTNIYVCADDHLHIYKIDQDLRKVELLNNNLGEKIKPGPMCIHKDKLIVANNGTFSKNFVSVLGLTHK